MMGLNKHRSSKIAELDAGIEGFNSNLYSNNKPIYEKTKRLSKPTKKRIVKRQTKEGIALENRVEKI